MRLLRTEGSERQYGWKPQLVESRGEKYAILSHRPYEPRFDDVQFCDIEFIDDGGKDGNSGRRHQQYLKNAKYSSCDLERQKQQALYKIWWAARTALLMYNLEFVWIESVCVDRSSSAEVDEAINGSWDRLADAEVCLAYLDDVPGMNCNFTNLQYTELAKSAWWSSSWTLQELLAPRDVMFLSSDWMKIGTKKRDLAEYIQVITDIDLDIILQNRSVETASIARRMSWASLRRADRTEDIAYSLMGLFKVNMQIVYGEGEKAFYRLQKEIIKESDDQSIFAWRFDKANEDDRFGLLARHPRVFRDAGNIAPLDFGTDSQPYSMTNRGLSIEMHMSHTKGDGELYLAALHCAALDNQGGYLAIWMKKVSDSGNQYVRVRCNMLSKINIMPKSRPVFVRQFGHYQQPLKPPAASRHSTQSSMPPLSKVSSPDSYRGRQSVSEISQLDTVESDRSVRDSMGRVSMANDPQRSRTQMRNDHGVHDTNGVGQSHAEREPERPIHRSTLSQTISPDVESRQADPVVTQTAGRESTIRRKLAPWRKTTHS